MNIPYKYLHKDSLPNEKIQYYQKLKSKYTLAFTQYHKKVRNFTKYRQNVLDWFFSLNLEYKMIFCSIENKKFTNIISKMLRIQQKSTNAKFLIPEDKEEPAVLDENLPVSSADSLFFNVIKSFLNEIRFYQCESSITDYGIYSNYITINSKVLNDRELFEHYFKTISKGKYFLSPIKTIRDYSSKVNSIQLPDWINEPNCYYSIAEFLVSAFEQAISVRYVMVATSEKYSHEILKNCYLKELLDKKKMLLAFMKNVGIKNLYTFFGIDELITRLYNDKELEKFIENFGIDDKERSGWFANPTFFSKDKNLQELKNELHLFLDTFGDDEEECINFFMLIHIMKLYTYDDFLFRGIFECIYSNYSKKNTDDLLNGDLDEEEGDEYNKEKKKKKKKKKKTKNQNYNSNNNKKDNNINAIGFECKNERERKREIAYKREGEFIVNEILNSLINDVQCKVTRKEDSVKNKKYNVHKKEKKKRFFLYDTTPKKDKDNNKHTQNATSNVKGVVDIKNEDKSSTTTESSNDSKPIKQKNPNTISVNSFKQKQIISNTNSMTFTSVITHKEDDIKTEILEQNNNIYFINHNPIVFFFESLETEIQSYISVEEAFLIELNKIKLYIKDFISSFTTSIYPNSYLSIYGSCLYQLDISSSDLDISITTTQDNNKYSLSSLACELTSNNNINFFDSVFPVLSASVPVIKVIISPNKLNNENIDIIYSKIQKSNYYINYPFNRSEIEQFRIDISINSINSNHIAFITRTLRIFPEMKPVIKIIKRVLQLHNLNIAFEGGIGSYCLFVMVYTIAKLFRFANSKNASPCILLIEFLMQYGTYINLQHTIINPNLNK